jgi:quercetin 2,3-dioxygenase
MLLEPRLVKLSTRTGVEVRRTLPNAKLRRIAAWVFVDHMGPTPQTDGMVVAAHPHTGLQTMTWLFEGKVEHRDSVGSVQHIEPGQLNLMTAGRGISHSEVSQLGPHAMHAAQLWIALPESTRNASPSFQHISQLPELQLGNGASGKLLVGELLGSRSPAAVHTALVAAELNVPAGSTLTLPVNANFEHGVLVVEGQALVAGSPVDVTNLEFVAAGANELKLEAVGEHPLKVLLIGGEPFDEPIVMWWNFIARTHEEIVALREAWNSYESADEKGLFGEVFSTFEDQVGGWIPAPELPNAILRARI